MQRYELILEHPNFQRRKMISRTDPVIWELHDEVQKKIKSYR